MKKLLVVMLIGLIAIWTMVGGCLLASFVHIEHDCYYQNDSVFSTYKVDLVDFHGTPVYTIEREKIYENVSFDDFLNPTVAHWNGWW